MKLSNKWGVLSCYIGYIVQAIVNTFMPLLYATFNTSFNISLTQIGLIATISFALQIVIDFSSTLFVDKIGYRASCIISHVLCIIGLIFLGILPFIMENKFLAIIISTFFMAIGGGLTEVVVSPMLQAIPLKNKDGQMAILHSFYCWGECFIVILSTLFFSLFSIDNWRFLPFIWAIIPLFNIFLVAKVPVYTLNNEKVLGKSKLFKNPYFYILFLMMVCAGASEIAMVNWASIFAEMGLNVDKSLGDILGPCLFALFMGLGRVVISIISKKVELNTCLFTCAIMCSICYAITIFVPNPFISLLGCAFTGGFVSCFWPGTYSLSAKVIPNGGTKMFAFFALGGDIGCTLGASIVGFISDYVENNGTNNIFMFLSNNGRGIRAGLLIMLIFPIIMIVGSIIIRKKVKEK